MAKVSKEAIQILAKRVSDVVDKKKEVAIPTKISKLIEKHTEINEVIDSTTDQLRKISNELSRLGYVYQSKYVKGVYQPAKWMQKLETASSNEIYNDIVLSLEFDKKDLASLEKELILKYSK